MNCDSKEMTIMRRLRSCTRWNPGGIVTTFGEEVNPVIALLLLMFLTLRAPTAMANFVQEPSMLLDHGPTSNRTLTGRRSHDGPHLVEHHATGPANSLSHRLNPARDNWNVGRPNRRGNRISRSRWSLRWFFAITELRSGLLSS